MLLDNKGNGYTGLVHLRPLHKMKDPNLDAVTELEDIKKKAIRVELMIEGSGKTSCNT